MKKSELKKYIREMILKEVSQDDVESAKELNKELEKTKELSDELGLTNESLNTFQNYSNNELAAYTRELSKQRADAASKGQTDLIASLNKDIEAATHELKKRSQNLKALSRTDETTEVNEAATDRFLKGAAYNLALQMRGKAASRTTLMNRLNRMPLANYLKRDELEKIVDYTMEEMGLNEIDERSSMIKEQNESKLRKAIRSIIKEELDKDYE